MTQSKEIETVGWRSSDGILITADIGTTLCKLLMKCFNIMCVRRREGERSFVIAGNKMLTCILKKDDTLIGVFDLSRWTDMLPQNVEQQLSTYAG
jgi:hypothetical protein